jgi:hypothetical protein
MDDDACIQIRYRKHYSPLHVQPKHSKSRILPLEHSKPLESEDALQALSSSTATPPPFFFFERKILDSSSPKRRGEGVSTTVASARCQTTMTAVAVCSGLSPSLCSSRCTRCVFSVLAVPSFCLLPTDVLGRGSFQYTQYVQLFVQLCTSLQGTYATR